MLLFLGNNGYYLDPPNDPVFADVLIAIIEHQLEEDALVRMLEPHLGEL